MECKGLEFQDVLLYNFFSSSPMRNHWEVIYEYMEKKDLQISTSPQHFQGFNLEKHTALCSELKQLYVAITRTRQRLWICEDEGFCDSVFNYWTKLNLVKVRKLDYESVKEMQIVSSQEEWKSRGIKSLGAEKDGLDIIQHEWALPKFEQRAEATLRKLIS